MNKLGHVVYISMLFVALIFLIKCTGKNSAKSSSNRIVASAEACSLVGTWTRCISNGTASGRISFIATETLVSQKTDTYLSNAYCAGLPDDESATDINYKLGAAGKSTFVKDGTDIDLTSSSDLGCGSDLTVYSVIKFSNNCTQFYPVQNIPGCSASTRGTILDTVPFEKQ